VNAHNVDRADWTKGVPGGPINGAAETSLTYAKGINGSPAADVMLTTGPGTMSDETLRWLAGLPAGIAAAGPITAKTVAFDRLTLRCRIIGDRGQFGGARDPDGTIPILTCRVLGVEVPILKASGQPFDAKALWAALAPALWPPPDNK
jgi:hypothetical protein